jgi:histidyl-tRNA synthetase
MRDLFGAEQRRHAAVRETARQVTLSYGFAEIETPVLEFTEVFLRTLGDSSDVVTKEIYAFRDQGEIDLCLRPENTASVMRALVSNGLTQALPQRLFYAGPMFRRERPQKGRYRQFSQVGVELIGAPEPLADVEVIACGQDFLSRLGLDGQLRLEINTLGDSASRSAYRAALVEYFSQHRAALSPESQTRLTQNPLRILDSKQEADRTLIAEAPRFDAYLNPASETFFAQVCSGLDALGIAYQRNPYLVRGLDSITTRPLSLFLII